MSDIRIRDHLSPDHWQIMTTIPTADMLGMIQALAVTSYATSAELILSITELSDIKVEALHILQLMYNVPCDQQNLFSISTGHAALQERILTEQTTMQLRGYNLSYRLNNLTRKAANFLIINERKLTDQDVKNMDKIIDYFTVMHDALAACIGKSRLTPRKSLDIISGLHTKQALTFHPKLKETPPRITKSIIDSIDSINEAAGDLNSPVGDMIAPASTPVKRSPSSPLRPNHQLHSELQAGVVRAKRALKF